MHHAWHLLGSSLHLASSFGSPYQHIYCRFVTGRAWQIDVAPQDVLSTSLRSYTLVSASAGEWSTRSTCRLQQRAGLVQHELSCELAEQLQTDFCCGQNGTQRVRVGIGAARRTGAPAGMALTVDGDGKSYVGRQAPNPARSK